MSPPAPDANGAGPVELAVRGMTCEGCAATVRRVLLRVSGVAEVRVHLAGGRAEVAGSASPEALIAAVQAAGFDARRARD